MTGVPLIKSTTYNAAGAATAVTYGNTDTDVFAFDSANRPSSITNTIQAATPYTMTTTLTWNPNSSLKAMAIADTNDPTKNQTCTYAADDLGRLASVNCGTTTWAQNFTYDPFGNINKTGAGNATPWVAAYNALTNQVSNGLVKGGYDANGNQLSSTGLSQITWTAGSLPASVTDLNNATHTAVYDALGRAVESNATAAKTLFLYGASGTQVAKLTTGTLTAVMVPLTGGETAVYNASGLRYLRHTDWLGSSRLATTWAHAVYSKESYAPFGETYNESGTPDRSFTGQEQDTVTGSGATGTYDFPARSYDPAAGRWLSPDPLGWGAASPAYPQSLNRYVYVHNNPLQLIDPTGLDCMYINDTGTSIESIDSSSSSTECGANGGTWVDGTINMQNTAYNKDTGLFNVVSLTGSSIIFASFQSGALFGPTGGLADGNTACYGNSCGGASFGVASLSWVNSMIVAGSASGFQHWILENGVPGVPNAQHPVPGSQKLLIAGGNTNYCGDGGVGAPLNHNDWACAVHDYNSLNVGANNIRSFFRGTGSILGDAGLRLANQTLINNVDNSLEGVLIKTAFTLTPYH